MAHCISFVRGCFNRWIWSGVQIDCVVDACLQSRGSLSHTCMTIYMIRTETRTPSTFIIHARVWFIIKQEFSDFELSNLWTKIYPGSIYTNKIFICTTEQRPAWVMHHFPAIARKPHQRMNKLFIDVDNIRHRVRMLTGNFGSLWN